MLVSLLGGWLLACGPVPPDAALLLLHAPNAQTLPSESAQGAVSVVPEFACQAGTPLEMRLTLHNPVEAPVSLKWRLMPDKGEPLPLEACPTTLLPDQPSQLFCRVEDLKALVPDCARFEGGQTGVGGFRVEVILGGASTLAQRSSVEASARFPSVKGLAQSPCTAQRDALSKLRKDPAQLDAYLAQQPGVRDCFLAGGFAEIAYRIQDRRVDQLQRVGAPPTERLEAARALIPLAPAGNPVRYIESRWLSARMALYAGEYHQAWEWLKEARTAADALGWEEPRGEVARVLAQWGMNVGDWELALSWGRTCMQLGEATRRDDLVSDCGLEVLAPTLAQTSQEASALDVASTAFSFGLLQYGPTMRSEAWTSLSNLGWLLLALQAPPIEGLRRVTGAVGSVLGTQLSVEQQSELKAIAAELDTSASVASAQRLAWLLFEVSLKHWESEGHASRIANAHRNLAWVALKTGRLAEATAELARAGEVPALEDNPRFAADHLHLMVRLALQKADAPQARATLLQLNDAAELAEGEVPVWTRQFLEGELLALEGKRTQALESWRASLESVRQASASAAFAGRAAGFVLHQREARERLLEQEISSPEAWLQTFHAGLPQALPSALMQSAEERRSSPAWARFVAALEKSAQHQLLRRKLPVDELKGWESEARHLQLEREEALSGLGMVVARPSVPRLSEFSQLLPEDAEVWVLESLPREVMGFRIQARGVSALRVPLSRERLLLSLGQIAQPLARRTPIAPELLAPLAPLVPPLPPSSNGNGNRALRVVLVLDPLLDSVPVGLLPVGSKTLVESLSSLSHATDLGSLAKDLGGPVPTWWGCPLVVADTDAERPLPSARLSVPMLKGLASCTQARVGAEATREAVLPLLQTSPVHWAVHGQARAMDLAGAWLTLGQNQALTALDLQRQRLFPGLMFMASCEGGAGGAAGAVLARAALSSGARAVIASRYLLPDVEGQAVTTAFYEQLSTGQAPAVALTSALQSAVSDARAAAFLRGGVFLVGDPGWRRAGSGVANSGPAGVVNDSTSRQKSGSGSGSAADPRANSPQ